MNQKRIVKLLAGTYLALTIYRILILIIVSAYSVPIHDDFQYALFISRLSTSTDSVGAAIQFMKTMYFTWQGAWFSMLIHALLNPLVHGGFPLLRWGLVMMNVLFFVTAGVFFGTVLRHLQLYSRKRTILVFGLFIYVVSAFGNFQQALFWFTGSIGYTLPLMMLLWCIICLLYYEKIKKTILLILASAMALFATGGTLANAGTVCWVLLTLCAAEIVSTHSVCRHRIILFAVSLVGALINAAAPGNFLRQSAESTVTPGSILTAISNTGVLVTNNLEWLLYNTTFGVLLLLLFFFGFYFSDHLCMKNIKYITGSALLLLTPFVMVFPVALGYGTAWMPGRCLFLLQIIEFCCYGNMAFLMGGGMGRCFGTPEIKKAILSVFSVIIITSGWNSDMKPSDYAYRNLRQSLMGKVIQNHYNETRTLLEELTGRQGEDVAVQAPESENSIPHYYSFSLSNKPEDNTAVADLYGLHSIRRSTED